jgi:KaiC/GvpD/RAD55 family RecA-like ATPase
MLAGRDKEIAKLIRNLEQGRHTLVYGAEGIGKSALLQELASRPSRFPVIYVGDCGSRRSLLEGALTQLRHI